MASEINFIQILRVGDGKAILLLFLKEEFREEGFYFSNLVSILSTILDFFFIISEVFSPLTN